MIVDRYDLFRSNYSDHTHIWAITRYLNLNELVVVKLGIEV